MERCKKRKSETIILHKLGSRSEVITQRRFLHCFWLQTVSDFNLQKEFLFLRRQCVRSSIFIVCVCMYICIYICMNVCMYICMHACMYVCSLLRWGGSPPNQMEPSLLPPLLSVVFILFLGLTLHSKTQYLGWHSRVFHPWDADRHRTRTLPPQCLHECFRALVSVGDSCDTAHERYHLNAYMSGSMV